jgi:hypothetical protein
MPTTAPHGGARLQLEHLTLLDHLRTSSIDNEIEESHPHATMTTPPIERASTRSRQGAGADRVAPLSRRALGHSSHSVANSALAWMQTSFERPGPSLVNEPRSSTHLLEETFLWSCVGNGQLREKPLSRQRARRATRSSAGTRGSGSCLGSTRRPSGARGWPGRLFRYRGGVGCQNSGSAWKSA